MDTPLGPALDVGRLDRHSLEALCALKLWEEVGITAGEARPAIVAASTVWLTTFLTRGAPLVAEAVIDHGLLARARAFYGPPRLVETAPHLARVA